MVYVLPAFPPEVPLKSYIQAIPELINCCNYVNDVLSFYKEEIVGEQANFVTNMANCHRISKIDALRRLAEDTAADALRAMKIVSGHPGAYKAAQAFVQGYIVFHLASPRYKLTELFKYQIE
ncbi:terpenoid synthase [Pluteus cervinus]|uniref:Terpenoid synthase n=1 Tax=Pluteus cervinus TaxID=181527 RepID=A0ACD3AKS2_9AGAR|nr:terpenoid synthase [Pluteus cervinus]